MSQRFDAIVTGAGPAGEVAAYRLNKQGLRVALTERELIGGECAYWACIPSKTLIRPAEARAEARRAAGLEEPKERWAEIAEYRDWMIRDLDDSKQVKRYERRGISVFKSEARIVGPGRVEVAGEDLETERIVLATGSEPLVPSIPGLEEAGYWTNREATTVSELPTDVVILGGGAVGIELGQMFQRYGTRTTIVEAEDRLLPREDPALGELIADVLDEEGVVLRIGERAREVSESEGRKLVRLEDGDEISGQEVVAAVGRRPGVAGIGRETVGIEAEEVGGVRVDERCRVGEGIWAIGDVTGILPFINVGKYQARIACADIGGEDPRADYSAIPRVVFSDPEIAAVGLTEQEAVEQGIEVTTSSVNLPEAIARPYTYEQEPRGELGVVADPDRGVPIGAWAFAPLAGEWIHQAALAIKTETRLDVLRDTVAQFPTFSEAYLDAVEALDA